MKVLITGMTAGQTGSKHVYGYASPDQLMKLALEAAGHEVTARVVVPGESLRSFHRVIVFMGGINGFVSRHSNGALWALASHPHVVSAFDDWHFNKIFGELRYVVTHDQVTGREALSKSYRAEAAKVKKQLDKAARDWLDGRWPILVPCFPWADLSGFEELAPKHELVRYDPSGFFPKYVGPAHPVRVNQWILASLQDHREWVETLNLTWPVVMFGNKKAGYPSLPEFGSRRTEMSIGAVCNASTGVLSYPYVGSEKRSHGVHWRARPILAAQTGAIIAGVNHEYDPLGSAYKFEPREIERLTNHERRCVAHGQAQAFFNSIWSKRKFTGVIDSYIRRL